MGVSRCTGGMVNARDMYYDVVRVFGDVENVLEVIGVRIGGSSKKFGNFPSGYRYHLFLDIGI